MSRNLHAPLTDELIRATPPPAKGEVRLWDVDFKAFLVRIWPSGRRSFCVRYRRSRAPEIYTIGTFGSPWTTEAARKKAAEVFFQYADSEKPARDRRAGRAVTVSELCERYFAEGPLTKIGKRESSWKLDVANLTRHVEPLLGKRVAADLKRMDVAAMLRDITNGATAGDVRTKKQGVARVRGGAAVAERALTSFRAMLNWAVAQEYLAENPARGLRLPKRPLKERFLSDQEAARLLAFLDAGTRSRTLNPQHATLIQLLLLTGARKSELMNLSWGEVDLQRRRLVLPPERSKSGRYSGYRRIPLSGVAMKLLTAIPRGNSEFVFPADRSGLKPMTGIHKVWKRICQEADLGDMRLHDLRHSFASFAIANGENIVHIAAALGHTSTRMTERYLHLRDDDVIAVAERMAQRITGGANASRGGNFKRKFP